ncbi:hypothetical protein LZ31DRAFT_259362 [Colletotrichum somersetense]|nr:hypothetical protein LZ31DRAFT_259362 [Colletotrichum somersetense]
MLKHNIVIQRQSSNFDYSEEARGHSRDGTLPRNKSNTFRILRRLLQPGSQVIGAGGGDETPGLLWGYSRLGLIPPAGRTAPRLAGCAPRHTSRQAGSRITAGCGARVQDCLLRPRRLCSLRRRSSKKHRPCVRRIQPSSQVPGCLGGKTQPISAS